MHKCTKCDKSFKSGLALRGHQRVHSDNYTDVQKAHTARLIAATNKKNQNLKDEYYKKPIQCLCCNEIISYEKTTSYKGERKFCNKSCAVTYNNKLRPKKSKEIKNKISKSLSSYYQNNPIIKHNVFQGLTLQNPSLANIRQCLQLPAHIVRLR